MSSIYIGLLLITVNTVGQLLLKKATFDNVNKIALLSFGYLLFIIAIIISYYLMKFIELKYFTVIMSSTYITVLFSSAYLFKETLNKNKLIGTFIVVVGIVIFIGE